MQPTPTRYTPVKHYPWESPAIAALADAFNSDADRLAAEGQELTGRRRAFFDGLPATDRTAEQIVAEAAGIANAGISWCCRNMPLLARKTAICEAQARDWETRRAELVDALRDRVEALRKPMRDAGLPAELLVNYTRDPETCRLFEAQKAHDMDQPDGLEGADRGWHRRVAEVLGDRMAQSVPEIMPGDVPPAAGPAVRLFEPQAVTEEAAVPVDSNE